ncbi:MAG: putative transcriptional regulator [Actinomycetota bacterium]|nr:putative transcriptional regulator [Actinomycetota bacterium]
MTGHIAGVRRLTGRLLVATPRLGDPNFRRAVVLVLDHNDDGALGIVVNHPLEVDVEAVLPDWQPFTTAPGRLFQGGPVQLDSALGIVAVPGDDAEPAGVRRIIGSLGLVDLDTPPHVVARGVSGLRIFAGYSGWSAGQLESEVADGAWYVVDAESRDPFSDSPETLWRQVLRRQRGELAFVSTYPEDPSLN